MKRSALLAVATGLALGACANGPLGPVGAPRQSDLPWELTPASTASEAQGEVTIVGHSKELGYVRGTKLALDNFHKPMVPFQRKSSKVVEPCRRATEEQAKELGAVWVEGALAGPEVRSRGHTTAPVFIRTLYKNDKGYEVRQAQISCTIDASGRLVDLKMGA